MTIPYGKQQRHYDAYTYTGVGEIEHRTEEHKLVTAPKRHPFRPCGNDNRKIEHINNLAHQERSVAMAERNEVRHIIRRRRIEYESVEHAVDKVAYRPGKNKRKAYNPQHTHLPAQQSGQIPAQRDNGDDTEYAKNRLVYHCHAKRHTVVFDKAYVKPVGNPYALVKAHPGLHGYFYPLVDYKQRHRQQRHRQHSFLKFIRCNHPYGQYTFNIKHLWETGHYNHMPYGCFSETRQAVNKVQSPTPYIVSSYCTSFLFTSSWRSSMLH